MKFPTFALSAIGASLAMLASAPAFAAAHTGKPMDSAMAASGTAKGEKSTKMQDKATKPAMSDTTRSEVKQEAVAADKAGTSLPAGENVTNVPGQKQTKGAMSDKSRSKVKSDAKSAKKAGTDVPPGEASSKAQEKGIKQ